MASELPPAQRASYSAIIDDILSASDLDTISAKAIRKGLQAKVDYDLSQQKDSITELIMERFNKVQREREAGASDGAVEPAPTTNGTAHAKHSHTGTTNGEVSRAVKRKVEDVDEDDDQPAPRPMKVKKEPKPEAESDEQIARRLQAEYSKGAGRSTRGGGAPSQPSKKVLGAKKEKKPKKKSATKIHSDDDSDVNTSSATEKTASKGGFNKLLNLSEPLQALLGETQLSRPQTVKRIWAYVKERELQDPSDKREIRCDELMRGVFKSERVNMFKMNKVLAQHFFPIEEA
ncbi:hypothetical protein BAUCODRAFT_127412 [Baudoinia panamericana UAMH 10762]|uniref:Uncharacterized protein n=1 Tax=Baudoinia panamericana (strain UAMH 10762) TaxID=717646 RepID=M2LC60_BAUPA|nr:uncharacterized protein BAUCODRAFT_127412 [Baudoinia panamericana UAMH 10762]EMC91512.1 hypothetical protein BAUCODRAFT_127412 [Baudoinia panamericana UAMH 10762]